MKKRLILISIICIVLIFSIGCSNEKSSSNEDTSDAATDQVFELKLGHNNAADSPRDLACKRFAELVEERSEGQIKIDIYASETFGTEQEMIEAVQSGTLDLQAAGGPAFSNWVPEVNVFALPFLFQDYEEAYQTQDGPVGDKIKDMAWEKGFKILSYWDLGFRQITNSKHPIETPEDLKGVKIRVPNEFVQIELFKQLEASSTTMPFGEVYLALSQGVIDGQENPVNAAYYSKFYEHQKYLSMTNHMYTNIVFLASKDLWDKLPEDLQEAVTTSAQEAGDYSRELVQEEEETLISELEDYGMEINYPDLDSFREASQIVYNELEEKIGKDIIDEALSFVEGLRK